MRSKVVLLAWICLVCGLVLAVTVGLFAPVLWSDAKCPSDEEYKIIVHQTTRSFEAGLKTRISRDLEIEKNYLLTGESTSLSRLQQKIDHWATKGYEVTRFSSCAITIDTIESEIVHTV